MEIKKIRRAPFTVAAVAAAMVALLGSPSLFAQAGCDTHTWYGGDATVTLVNAIERLGTAKSNMNALENDGQDASYYQLSNDAGFTQALFATEMISDSAADNDHAPFAVIFVNPTNSAMTVTQIDLVSAASSAPLFRISPAPAGISPGSGTWSAVPMPGSNTLTRNIRWTGTINVPAHSGVDFIVDAKISNASVDIPNVTLTGLAQTSAGPFTTAAYPTDVFVPTQADKVATGVVAFDNGSFPRGYVPNLSSGVPNTLSVRVQEYANNQAIAAGMKLNITIPAAWSNVSVVSAPAPWNGAVTITQPTASTPGLLTVTTTAAIVKGTTTAAFQFRATPPVAYADSVYNMQLKLDGFDTSTKLHPVKSICDGVVHVLPGARAGIQAEFLSPALTAGAPISSIDFRMDYNSINGSGTENYTISVYNFSTGLWEDIKSSVPGTADTTATASYSGIAVASHIDASRRMRIRVNSADSSTTRTLRVDFMRWTVAGAWYVDGAAGNDANLGSASSPLKTIAAAAARTGGGEVIYVNSTGVADAGNIVIAAGKNGTAQCPTVFRGLPDLAGNLPRITGSNPTSDVGFDIEGNYAVVDKFEINATQVGLYAAAQHVSFTNNIVKVPDYGYGILFYNASNGAAYGNRVVANGSQGEIGIWDSNGAANLIDSNKVTGFASRGIYSDSSSGVTIQRNIAKANRFGIYLARVSGTALMYNNTLESTYMNAYAEASAVTSRNNILLNGVWGWRWNGVGGGVNSNFDDVFGNTYNYGSVTAGASSISANPNFVQTTDPTQATYYKLNAGSPCVNAGTNVGLPANGTPDIGAVEN